MDERDRRKFERKLRKAFWKCAPYLFMLGGYLTMTGLSKLAKGQRKNDRNGMSLAEMGHGWHKEQYLCGPEPASSFKTPEAARIATEMITDLNGDCGGCAVAPIFSRAQFEDGETHDVLIGVIKKDPDGTFNGNMSLSEWLARALNDRFLPGNFRGRAFEDPNGDGFIVDRH